jgi:hypothetical protein
MKWLIIVILFSFVQAQQDSSATEPNAPQTPAVQSGEQPAPLQLYPDNAVQITQFAEVAQAIASASSEIMLATDVLRSEEIAEAIRVAVVTRGVPVYILTPEESVEDPSSYLVSLALAGANVRVGPVEGSFVTIDRQSVVVGVLVSGVVGLPGYEEKDRTILVPDEVYTAPYVESFYQAFDAAPVLDPESLSIFSVEDTTVEQTEGGE